VTSRMLSLERAPVSHYSPPVTEAVRDIVMRCEGEFKVSVGIRYRSENQRVPLFAIS
jgi:hypothetical protein